MLENARRYRSQLHSGKWPLRDLTDVRRGPAPWFRRFWADSGDAVLFRAGAAAAIAISPTNPDAFMEDLAAASGLTRKGDAWVRTAPGGT